MVKSQRIRRDLPKKAAALSMHGPIIPEVVLPIRISSPISPATCGNGRRDMRQIGITVQAFFSGVLAYISAKLGILFPVLLVLMGMMVVDYITGMMASKVEAVDHPEDPSYGWSSKKGVKGIIKKVGYLCVIAVAMVVDYVIVNVADTLGYTMPVTAIFGLMVAVWYLLNEMLSIIENAGRMGAPVPEWLARYIAALKHKVDQSGEQEEKE